MRVQIAARHCEVPPPVRERARELAGKLRRYEERLSAAEIVFEEEGHRRKVEGIFSVDRAEPVIARGQADDFRGALDRMASRASRILRKRRSVRRDHQAPSLAEAARILERSGRAYDDPPAETTGGA